MYSDTASFSDIVDKTFDYIICGGGTAGLTLAARLTEDPSISVAVLEAGLPNIGDPKIVIPGQFGHTLGNPKYDWCFQTVPQKYSKNKAFSWSRGKGLGGTSCMNFYMWCKPPAGDIDAIEKLGNPGWNWKEYMKYTLRSETFHEATEEQKAVYPHVFEKEYRGTSGPIQTTVPRIATTETLFQEMLVKKGAREIKDPYGGDITGTWIAASNIDRKTWTRSYSLTGYYLPNKDRPNLKVLTEATVSRVRFKDATKDELLTATGVEFIHDGSGPYLVRAKKEVILSAGSIKSPQILELSGIGRKDVLSRIGVKQELELPVGENVQEHNFMGVSFELNPDDKHETLDQLDPEYATQQLKLHAEGKGLYCIGLGSFAYLPLSLLNPEGTPGLVEGVAKDIEEQKKSGKLPPGLAEQFDVQLQTLRDDTLPDTELIGWPGFFTPISTPDPAKRYITVLAFLNHPFSRGTIHAKSKDPLDQPEIDPRYFENDFDLQNMVEQIKYIKTWGGIEPWKSRIVREVDPGPECQTEEQIREYVLDSHGTGYHTIGSCSMLPREKNGVVDSNLKVYGTTNVRVVDLSVIPIHIAAHTQATAYMVAEKAADIIRGFQE